MTTPWTPPFAARSPEELDRSSYVPLYLQIKRELLRQIAEWDTADLRFYSDEELCSRFNVSRMTARQAVKELVDEGFLARERGVGTFLNKKKVLERPVTRLGERLSFDGAPFQLSVRKFEFVSAPVPVAEVLDLPPGSRVLHIVRTRHARGIAVSEDERWIPEDSAQQLTRDEVTEVSLVRWLGSRYKLVNSEMQFEGGVATQAVAKTLGIGVGDPVLIRHLTYRDGAGRAHMTGHSIHRSDVMRYSVSIKLNEMDP